MSVFKPLALGVSHSAAALDDNMLCLTIGIQIVPTKI